jgi:hypothetical protein
MASGWRRKAQRSWTMKCTVFTLAEPAALLLSEGNGGSQGVEGGERHPPQRLIP